MEEQTGVALDLQEEKSIIPINSKTFEQILQLGIDLNHIFILEGFAQGTDLTKHINAGRGESWKQTLIRKGYLSAIGEILPSGNQLLSDIGIGNISIVKKKREKQELIVNNFDLWWKAYPGTDNFTYKGKQFKGSRTLRQNKEQCIPKIHKILTEGEYTIEEMIGALELEKTQKMEESIRVGHNKMSYFQNSLTYLNQRTFEPFIELLRTPEAVLTVDAITKRIDI